MSSFKTYYDAYLKAVNEGNLENAKKFGNYALDDAIAEKNRNGVSSVMKQYYEEVISDISGFLANPVIKKSSATTISDAGTEGQIKSTDWFAAPIPDLDLNAIAGLQDVKNEFWVNIHAPTNEAFADIYKKYRGEEKGLQVLLYGPPGTGKTHAVKCLAGAMQCKIAVVQIKDVMANLVGDGAKIIAEIFEQARKLDKCIIFFDEIDAIASSRESDDSRHTKEQLTTLLTNMDGFTSKTRPGQIRIVIAATNRPWALDSAVKRGGRFDTQIYVPLPDPEARAMLIKLSLKDYVPRASDVTIDWLVERTEGYSGADIKAICRQAISLPLKREILARLNNKNIPDRVTRDDFNYVFDRYINPTNEEDLMRFDAYTMNMDYDNRDYKTLKCKQLCDRIHKGILPEHYEEEWLKLIYTRKNRRDYADLVSAEMLIRLDALKKGKPFNAAFKKEICSDIAYRMDTKMTVEDYERDWINQNKGGSDRDPFDVF